MFTLIAALVAVAATAASYYQQKKMQKQAAKQANEMAAVQVSGHDSNRALYTVYGETLVGSTTVWKRVSSNRYGMTDSAFQNLSKATGTDLSGNSTGKNNRYLYRMVALCNGPVESVTNVVIDGEGYNASRFSAKATNLHFAAAAYRGETAGATLNNLVTGFPETSSMKGQEVAYSVERCYLHKDAPAFQGEPSTQYIVKGRKIYDPRKDSTSAYYNSALGVATHRSTTPTTWQWSDNPSLCLLDYLHSETYGRGLAYADIDLASFVSAATKCEVQVAVPARLTNTTGNIIRITAPMFGLDEEVAVDATLPNYRTGQTAGNTQNRYRLNLAVDGSADVLDNVQKILNCFKGNLIFANGKYTVTLDDVASPVLSLNNDDILGGLKITNGDRNQRVNRATVKFLNSNKDYKTDQVSWPAIDSSEYTAYLTEDQGEKLHKTYTVEGCVDFYQAEDTAEYLVRDSRVTTTVSGKFGPRALGLVPGDVVSLTYDSGGYVGTYFRVNQVSLDVSTLEVTLQLREYDSSVYTWNASKGNEPLGLSWGEDAFNLEPAAPTLGTISHAVITSGDGSSVVQVTVPFTDVPAEADSVAVAWSLQNADTFTTILMPDVGAQTSAVFIAPSDDATYTVELRYFITNLNGRVFPSATATSDYAVPAITGTKLDGIATGATRNVVYQQATEPTGGTYNTNDTWIDTDDLKQYFWDGAAWTAFAEGDATAALVAAAAAEATADGKIEVFYSNDAPSGLDEKEGDLWFDLNDGNKLYRYVSTVWTLARDTGIAAAVQAAADADAKADGKVTTFFAASTSVPTALSVGDLWWTTDTSKFYRATAAGDDQIVAGEWELTDIVAASIDSQGPLATSTATEASVLNENVTVASIGGLEYRAPADDETARLALTNLVTGTAVYQIDTQILYVYNGSAWVTWATYNTGALADLDTINLAITTAGGVSGVLPVANTVATQNTGALADLDTVNLAITTAGGVAGVLPVAYTEADVNTINLGDSVSGLTDALAYTGGGTYTGALAATENLGALADLDTVNLAITTAGGVAGVLPVAYTEADVNTINLGDSVSGLTDALAYTGGGTYTGALAATENLGALADEDAVDLATADVTGTLGTTNAAAGLINANVTVATIGGLEYRAPVDNATDLANLSPAPITGTAVYQLDIKVLWVYNGSAWVTYASYGAQAGTSLTDSTGTVLGDTDVVTSQGTANDTTNVNSVAAATVESNASTGAALTTDSNTLLHISSVEGVELNEFTLGNIKVKDGYIHTNQKTTFASAATVEGLYIGSNGQFAISDGVENIFEFDPTVASPVLAIKGAITADSGSFTGEVNASAGAFTGDVSTDSKFIAGSGATSATMDGGDQNYKFYAGAATAGASPFKVDASGTVTADRIVITRPNDPSAVIFDSAQDGLVGVGLSSLASGSDTAVSQVADELTSDTDYARTILSATQNLTIKTLFPLGYLPFAINSAEDFPDSITLTLQVANITGGVVGTFANVSLGSKTFTRRTLSGAASDDNYYSVYASGTGWYVGGKDAIDSQFNLVMTKTFVSTPADRAYRVQVSYVAGSGSSTANPSSSSDRTLYFNSSSQYFTIDSNNVIRDQAAGSLLTGDVILTASSGTRSISWRDSDTQDETFSIVAKPDINEGGSNTMFIKYNNGTTAPFAFVGDGGNLLIAGDFYTGLGAITAGTASIGGGYGNTGLSIANDGNLSTDGNVIIGGTITATGGTSTEWNTAYTYSTVGHLPLAGGALTGNLDIKKIGADTIVDIRGNSNYDPVLNLRSDQGAITTEGFQIWYDNSVGDVHLHTTHPVEGASAIRFHTATGTDKATNNERFTIHGNGLVNIVSGNLAMGGSAVITNDRSLFPTSIEVSGSYSGGTGDFTNVTNAQLKIGSAGTLDFWRIPHFSTHASTSGVYNYETGKDVYWGEPADTGTYYFRGRALDVGGNATFAGTISSGAISASGDITTGGYVQHTGVLYSRNNLLVLNTAGTGWNTWATRSSGIFNLNVGTISSGAITSTSTISGTALGVTGTNSATGLGISLYGGASGGEPTYGLMFQGVGTFGTHGSVTADWATYFTMNSSAGRGWIFRDVSTPTNVASISNTGNAAFNGTITSGAITSSGIITATGGNSGNWNTAYTVANAALPKAGGAMTGAITTNSTFDGRDVATDGAKLDQIKTGGTLATYGTTAGVAGRIRCTAPFNTNTAHMFKVTVSIYSSYEQHDYAVGGYMYPTQNQWYLPTAIYTGTGSPDIIVGRDANGKAYISIANGNYTGVRVHSMTLGYQTSLVDTQNPWTITIDAGTENSVTPTISKVWHSTNDGSTSGLDADLLDGQHGAYYGTATGLTTATNTANAALPKAGGAMTGAITTNSTFDGVDIAVRDGVLTTTTATANAALPKAGGAMTGAITTNSTFDGVDIAVRDGVLTTTTATANAALPKAGGTLSGNLITSGSGNYVLIGGAAANNAYNTVAATTGLMFGGANDPNNYSIGTTTQNIGGTYTKLNIKWHTGIRVFSMPQYGGVRFYSDAAMATETFSVNNLDGHVRVANNLYANGGNLVLNASNYNSYSPTLTGTGASGSWGISVTGSSASCTGNAATATTATTANALSLNTGKISLASGAGGATFAASHYSIGVDIANSAWSSPNYSDLIIGYHTGIRIGASYTGIRFYNNSPTTDTNNTGNGNGGETLLMTVGGVAGGTGVLVANTLTAGNLSTTGTVTATGGTSTNWNTAYTVANAALPKAGGTVTGSTSLRAGGSHLGNHEFASASSTTTGYSDAGIEIREGAYGGTSGYSAPRLAFHWGGVVASNISMDTAGAILIRNNPGTGYENLRANNIYANGTNLVLHAGNYNSYSPTLTGTGASGSWGISVTGSSASCTGNAATATALTAGSKTITGDLTVGTGTSSNIYMGDSDEGIRRIHCNSNRIGFLTSANGWGPYCEDGGRWVAPQGITGTLTGSATTAGTVTTAAQPSITSLGTLTGVSVTGTAAFTGAITVEGNTIWNGSDTWCRIPGATGVYFSTYAGGVYMVDTSWVRVYNAKALYVANQIAATGNITAYYSDERLKTKTGNIENALEKVKSLSGFNYVENDLAKELGYTNEKQQVGLSAQQVQAVLPEAVSLAPVDMETDEFSGEITSKSGENYLTVDYSRLVPLLVEAIKEQQEQIDELRLKLKEK